MTTRTVLARSLPYPPKLLANQRICRRCGIQFRSDQSKRDQHLKDCRDCRGMQ